MATQSKIDKFIKCYILTGCQDGKQACIDAGYSVKTASQQASRLLKNVKVQQTIKDQKKLSTKLFIKTKEEKLLILESVMKQCANADNEKGMLNANAVIAAIKEHNLMQGDNEPLKVENKHVIDSGEHEW